MYSNPLNAYQETSKATMSGREIEASVLMRAAKKLKACQDNWDAADRDEQLDIALKFNQRIWTIFQGELGKKENPLPDKLKLDMLHLSRFVDKRIFETMAFPAADKLTVLININNNIAAGLMTRPAVSDPDPVEW